MRILCWKCSGHGSATCDVCHGRKVKATPGSDGTLSFFACSACGTTGKSQCQLCQGSGWIDHPDSAPRTPPYIKDPLAGTWTATGGAWVISKTNTGYQVVEHGAAGPVGEGRVTSFDGDTVVVSISNKIMGHRQDVMRLRGNFLRKVNGFPITYSRC
ncbi:hypothetical protein [Silvibacterium acidisoli]|uniref:hypothetical protein n=1 Tax=Acidobacteriaceae bacterium ZG23-2 TaxID=2883246 RepID=UPI00406D2811